MQSNVGLTILKQLGGNRFRAMTGAKSFLASPDSLSFALPGNPGYVKDGINRVEIKLAADDTYNVTFSRVFGRKVTVKSTFSGIYCDMLVDTFQQETGLRTSLGGVVPY